MQLKRRLIIATGLIFFSVMLLGLLGSPIFLQYQEDMSYRILLPAISKTDAKRMQKEDEAYVVQYKKHERNTSALTTFYYKENEEDVALVLIGNSPLYELSNTFLEPELNEFLVKGHIDTELTEYCGEKVFFVDDWYFIEPVKRAYRSGLSTDAPRPDERMFYPKDGLDEYDLQRQDYVPTAHYGDIFMTALEMDYYADQDGYYSIMPYASEERVEWFEAQIDMSQFRITHREKISLEGNLPEYALHEWVLENDPENPDNYFLVKGQMRMEKDGKKTIEIYKWWRHHPFYDIGESEWGFTKEDAKRGIYKTYR